MLMDSLILLLGISPKEIRQTYNFVLERGLPCLAIMYRFMSKSPGGSRDAAHTAVFSLPAPGPGFDL